MIRMLRKLWHDDRGAVMASEMLFMFSMLVVGTVTGLAAMRQALVSEMVEAANAIMSLNQTYSFSGNSIAGVASSPGSSAVDHTNTISLGAAAPMDNAAIGHTPCD